MGNRFVIFAFSSLALMSCSKSNPDSTPSNAPAIVQSFPVANGQFKNCHFQFQTPTYGTGAPIAPNPVQCQEGVAKSVSLLSPTALPTGLSFSMDSLSLVGTPTEKVSNAPYDFYIENEAGYLILHLVLTVK